MILAIGLLVAGAVIGWSAPRYLAVTVAPGLNPRLALTAWATSIVLALAAAAAAPFALLTRPGRTTFGAAHTCVQQLRDDGTLPWMESTEVALAAVLWGLLAYVAISVGRQLVARYRAGHHHARALDVATVARTRHRGVPVAWIEADDPVCYSTAGPGTETTVVASRHIRALPPSERDAVLDHEVGHLRGRHHLLVALAEAFASAVPAVPLLREAPGAVRTLVEFAADRRAAADHGAATVGSALITVHAHTVGTPSHRQPSTALALSREAVVARLFWLRTEPSRRQRLARPLDYPFAVALACAPLAASVAAMLAAAALACLQLAA